MTDNGQDIEYEIKNGNASESILKMEIRMTSIQQKKLMNRTSSLKNNKVANSFGEPVLVIVY